MVQNAIKILTLGFFVSMITGFVFYRSGYFDSEKSGEYLQTSPNGGELLAQVDQDTAKSPEINNANAAPIMPSSKSAVPILDVESVKQDKKRQLLPSSKSITHVIDVEPGMTANQIEDKKREAFRQQPELEVDSNESTTTEKRDSIRDVGSLKSKVKAVEETESTHINWRAIWIGVLGILFVAIGSIVYFKRRSK